MKTNSRQLLSLVAVALVLLPVALTPAEDWPRWRGPRGDGSSMESDIPMKWDGASGENIRWKTKLPGAGHGSPIVMGNNVFLAGCNKETRHRLLMCLDATNGKVVWQRTILECPLESKHSLNSFASCTPATDGSAVYVAFLEVDGRLVPAPNVGSKRDITPGTVVVAAYTIGGKHLWTVRPGSFISAHGFCSNPIIHGEKVIVNCDHDGESYIVALNKKTGKTIWKEPRRHKTRSYVTPIVRKIKGREELVFSGSKCIVGLNPETGKRLWSVEGPTEQFVASMVYDGELFFMACGYPTYHVMGIRPGGKGDVTNTHVAWHSKKARCYVPSPVVVGKYLFVADDRGTANCFDAKTGERYWQERMGKHYSASLIHINGLAYFLADDGIVKIVKPGKQLEVIAINKLGENCYASPAVANTTLYIRGDTNLYAIGKAF